IVAGSRDYLVKYQPAIKNKLIKSVWTGPGKMNLIHGLTRFYQKSGLRELARKTGLIKGVAGELAPAEQLLNDVPSTTAFKALSFKQEIRGPQKYKIGYFLGCATNLYGAATASALVKVLNRHGCEVIIPQDLKCCGLPQYANSHMEQAKEMARYNIKAMTALPVDYIVTDCASCSSTLKGSLYRNWEDPEMQQLAAQFLAKVYDINAFLSHKLELIEPQGKLEPIKVTYHDPCHLARSQKIKEEPRRILSAIPGVELVEMAVQDQCCGGAGTFSFFNYDLSMKILDRKMTLVKNTGARIIATSCPACAMQLTYGLERAGISGRVVHPVELLEQSYAKHTDAPSHIE
ncbi:MAG: (Fe-S)-binding protein, partial [Clostridia bacterium]|nr:(Fe-S)-binding protein [Clostridia bacterium]